MQYTGRSRCTASLTLAGVLAAGCGEGDAPLETLATDVDNPLTSPAEGPPAGNPDGACSIPLEATPVDTRQPDRVVGSGGDLRGYRWGLERKRALLTREAPAIGREAPPIMREAPASTVPSRRRGRS